MCVTSSPAIITDTKTYVVATQTGSGAPRHISGYQNASRSVGPNCMFLHFRGTGLSMVAGPENTNSFMDDMTSELPALVPVSRSRGAFSYGDNIPKRGGVSVVEYGAYTCVLAQGPANMLGVLDQVPPDRRPIVDQKFEQMLAFYMSWSPDASFVLACSSGYAKPQHPIVVGYTPNDPDVLTIPALDGHDGNLPTPGATIPHEGFAVAFGIQGVQLPHRVSYNDWVDGMSWAPSSVAGFIDNRPERPNVDYAVTVDDVREGLTGRKLADTLAA